MAVDLKRAYERNVGKVNNNPPLPKHTVHGDGKTARIVTNTYVLLHIDNVKEPVIFCPSRRMTLGRWHEATPRKPDIDLAPYSARENGVSRIHAAIQMQDDNITIKDMGSCNGTRVNGVRVQPGESFVLSDGDEIRLGRLAIEVGIKIQAPTNQDRDAVSVPAARRQMGAGMLRPITPLAARQTSVEDDDDTLVLPESRPQRSGCYKSPDFAGQLNRDSQSTDGVNFRPDVTAESQTQMRSSVIRPLSRQSTENSRSTIETTSQRDANLIRPLNPSMNRAAVQQAGLQNRAMGGIRPLGERTVEIPAVTDATQSNVQKETAEVPAISANTGAGSKGRLLQRLAD
jgi:predicted component of type VI protein secretion system